MNYDRHKYIRTYNDVLTMVLHTSVDNWDDKVNRSRHVYFRFTMGPPWPLTFRSTCQLELFRRGQVKKRTRSE